MDKLQNFNNILQEEISTKDFKLQKMNNDYK